VPITEYTQNILGRTTVRNLAHVILDVCTVNFVYKLYPQHIPARTVFCRNKSVDIIYACRYSINIG